MKTEKVKGYCYYWPTSTCERKATESEKITAETTTSSVTAKREDITPGGAAGSVSKVAVTSSSGVVTETASVTHTTGGVKTTDTPIMAGAGIRNEILLGRLKELEERHDLLHLPHLLEGQHQM